MVIHGFKSFAKRTEFVFGDKFNVVLGPNGSGKSNVLDAICFVLGRMSAKSLRAEKSSNLIYNGGKEKKPGDKAEVSIYFDNTTKVFPIDTPEVKITRIVKKEGGSDYRLNDKRWTRQQVVDMLSAAKIDPDGYNKILQGDIIKLIEMSGMERRQILEEIAGISIYEDKKQKAMSELDKVDGQIKEAEVILTERETYLKELKKDRDQALKYKDAKDNIDRCRATVLFHDIEEKRTEVGGNDKGKKDEEARLKKLQEEILKLTDKIAEKKKGMDDITKDIEQKGEKDQVAIMKEIEQLRVDIATNTQKVENLNSQLKDIAARREQLKLESKDADTKSSGIRKRISELSARKTQVEKEQKQIEDSISQFKKKNDLGDIPELEQGIQEIDKKIETQQEVVQKLRESQQNLLREKDRLEIQIQNIDQTLDKVKEVEKENDTELKNLKSKRDYFKSLTLDLNKCLAEDSSLAAQLAKNREELIQKREELSKLSAAAVGINENMRADIAIKKIMDQKKTIPGIFGTVAELGKVNSKYSLAMEIAASSRTNNIVVQDDKVAADCIRFLKENKFGTATFLPLNKIKAGVTSPEVKALLKFNGVQGLAVELIEYDMKFKNIFQYVFGDTLIVDTIDVARRIGIGMARMVSLDGDIAERSGAMTGGYRNRSRGLAFQEKETSDGLHVLEARVNELEALVAVLQSRRAENEKKITELRTGKATIEGEILKVEKSLHLEQGDTDVNKKQKEQYRAELKECEAKLAKLSKEISDANTEFAKVRIQKEEVRGRINKLQNPRLLAELNTFEQTKERLKGESLEAEHEIIGLERQIKDMIGPEMERIGKILKQLDKDEELFTKNIGATTAKITSDNDTLKLKEEQQKEFMKKYKDLFTQRDNLNKEGQVLEGDKIRKEEQSRQVEMRINNISLRNASVSAVLAGLEKEYERYQGLELIKDKTDQALKSEITRFENLVTEMGNINLKALEVYESVESQYKDLLKKKDLLGKEKEEVLKLMAEIESRKGELFMKTFDKINESFQVIFDQLTAKGKAYLMLENPEKPFDEGVRIMVKITGQRFMDIRSLSGGEKSLTALAFLFAIQEYEPATFYVLDEVDAALDKHNSEKLAKWIRKYSEGAQYVVISHNDAIISEADNLYGVSMDEHSSSNMVSLKV
jgi:chromosome segregation protein